MVGAGGCGGVGWGYQIKQAGVCFKLNNKVQTSHVATPAARLSLYSSCSSCSTNKSDICLFLKPLQTVPFNLVVLFYQTH